MGACVGGRAQIPATVIILGLDGAGKTTLIQYLSTGESQPSHRTTPTIGFVREQVKTDKVHYDFFDVAGAEPVRDLWTSYMKKAQGVIFVVDSVDTRRLNGDYNNGGESANFELHNIIQTVDLNPRAPLLVFANKQDMRNALSSSDIEKQLDLNKIAKQRPWHIQMSSAISGDGIEEGIQWLSQAIIEEHSGQS